MYLVLQHLEGVVVVNWGPGSLAVSKFVVGMWTLLLNGVYIVAMAYLPLFDVIVGGVGLNSVFHSLLGWGTSIALTGVQTVIWSLTMADQKSQMWQRIERLGIKAVIGLALLDTGIDALGILAAVEVVMGTAEEWVKWLGFAAMMIFALAGEVLMALIMSYLKRQIARGEAAAKGGSLSEAELASMGVEPSDAFPPANPPGMYRR